MGIKTIQGKRYLVVPGLRVFDQQLPQTLDGRDGGRTNSHTRQQICATEDLQIAIHSSPLAFLARRALVNDAGLSEALQFFVSTFPSFVLASGSAWTQSSKKSSARSR